jgi:multiple antibiotic resistance protein
MEQELTLFIATFTTLLAVINPLEAMPVFLRLLAGKDDADHRQVARRSCIYATLMMFFFLVFGNLILRLFGVPLSMVRIVGGFILMRIGFELFSPSSHDSLISSSDAADGAEDVSFVPLAMPIMFGPGVLATVLGMTSTIKGSARIIPAFAAVSAAILATMFTTYMVLLFSKRILRRIGPKGVDAATRMVGFFVSAMGMGLIFHGVVDALHAYGVIGRFDQ